MISFWGFIIHRRLR